MGSQSVLHCTAMGQNLELKLSDCSPNMASVDLVDCNTVFEDGWYEIDLLCNEYSSQEVESITVNVNGKQVGFLKIDKEFEQIKGSTVFHKVTNDNPKSGQPFLLQYDLVIVSFVFAFEDGTFKELFTDFLLCVSKNPDDVENINRMIEKLVAFDDSQVNEWLFSGTKKAESSGLREGKWQRYAYKSLSSYIQLLESIVICYKSNYPYFRSMGKHTIKKKSLLQSYQSATSVTVNSFQWLMQNSDQLSEVPIASGIQYQGKNYLPLQIRTETSKKSWDVYENEVIICFLHTVLINSRGVYSEFDRDVSNEERIYTKMNGNVPKEYRAPIFTIKSLQVSFCRVLLNELANTIEVLRTIYKQYTSLFDIRINILTSLPRKTKTFQEIKPYTQVFSAILRWFSYGEFSLERDRLILQVKTLDKLFEYFCLIELLGLFAEHGYQRADVDRPAFPFEYSVSNGLYQNETDIANTYLLRKGDIEMTVYYQPVISATQFQNKLALYRTTQPYDKAKPDYYTPDFVVKFVSSNGNEDYIILDSKFSSRFNIRTFYLSDVIHEYSTEVAVAGPQAAPKMVWILQGRVKQNEAPIWRYHNSPLASQYPPKTSFGVVSINTTANVNQRFWNELKANIPWI